MPVPSQVIVFLPPGHSSIHDPLKPPPYPSLGAMERNSKRIWAALEDRGIELVERSWVGSVTALRQERHCLVHLTCTLNEVSKLIEVCDQQGHLLFCSDRIYNGDEREPSRAVELWLDTLAPSA